MIGSTVSTRSVRLSAKPVRVTISANARPSAGRAGAAAQRQQERVPRDAAAAAAGEAAQAPDLLGRQPLDQQRRHEARRRRPGSACSRMRRTGKKVKSTTSAVTVVTAPATKASPLKAPRARARCESSDQQRDQRRARRRRPCPTCRVSSSPNSAVEPVGRPAAQADGEALRDEQDRPMPRPSSSERAAPVARRPAGARSPRRRPAPAAPAPATSGRCASIWPAPRGVVLRRPQAGEPGAQSRSRPAARTTAAGKQPAPPTRLAGRPALRSGAARHHSGLGQRADLLVPAREQALALGRLAVLREVVVDQLDVGELRRLAAAAVSPCSTAPGTAWPRRRASARRAVSAQS